MTRDEDQGVGGEAAARCRRVRVRPLPSAAINYQPPPLSVVHHRPPPPPLPLTNITARYHHPTTLPPNARHHRRHRHRPPLPTPATTTATATDTAHR